MKIDIVTLFPEMIKPWITHSIVKRAIDKSIVKIYFHNPRDFASNKYKKVDDYAYGGGAGMVMMVEPLSKLLDVLLKNCTYDEIIYLTPDGNVLNQKTSNNLSLSQNLILICGHYKGIDERIREQYVTKEISIGDFVLTSGELVASVLCDSIIRIIPGVLSDETSALKDSFQDDLLAPPVYTRPKIYNGWEVPKILTSGNLKEIEKWRMEQAYKKTKERRPHLLE